MNRAASRFPIVALAVLVAFPALTVGPGALASQAPSARVDRGGLGDLLENAHVGLRGQGSAGGEGATSTTPTFAVYPAPGFLTYSDSAGEVGLGANPNSDALMMQMSLDTVRIVFNDFNTPPTPTWSDQSFLLTSLFTLDPVLFTDKETGRTFVAQDASECGLAAYTDNDGDLWTPMALPCGAPGFDHPYVGGGPWAFPLNVVQNPVYKNSVFYCAQQGLVFGNGNGLGYCSMSLDGGLTFQTTTVMNLQTCGALFGHGLSGPDGTHYVPFRDCPSGADRSQGVIESPDNGITWVKRALPTSRGVHTGMSDPTLAFDGAGRLWMGMTDRNPDKSGGRALVTWSDDDGAHWGGPVDVGALAGVKNAEFPMMVAGDAGRVAIGFYGSPDAGDDQDNNFAGTWYLYAAFSYDGGATWTVQNLTPGDPVQRGAICLGGINCTGHRNLLDFQSGAVDGEGRVAFGFSDGCTSAKCIGPTGTPADSNASHGTVARQYAGSRLVAAFGP